MSFRIDWLDVLGVQGILKGLLQHHSSKASIVQCSAFFIVQLSHPYMTTGKTIALTRQTFVGKVMSLFFNILSRLVWRRERQPTPLFLPGESNGQRRASWATVQGVTKSRTRLSDITHSARLVITFLPRSKRLNFMAAVTICSDFGAKKK